MKAEIYAQLPFDGGATRTRSSDSRREIASPRTIDFDQLVFPNFEQTIFTLDPAGNFKFVSEAAERLTGYSREELCRLNVLDLLPGSSNRDLNLLVRQTLRQRVGSVLEIEITTRDRRQIKIETSIDFVRTGGGMLEFRGIAVRKTDDARFAVRPRCLDERFSFETSSATRSLPNEVTVI
jgi:PAS domain S-box-containing protein